MDKLAKFFNNAKSIWAGILLLYGGALFAGNLQWLQITEYKEDQKVIVIQQINRELAELQIKLIYIQDQQQKDMIKAIIINKKSTIENIREK